MTLPVRPAPAPVRDLRAVLKRMPATLLYPKGATIVCVGCGLPLYVLQGAIWSDEPVGQSGWKYGPVRRQDIEAVLDRRDLDPGMRAAWRQHSPEFWRTHCESIPSLRAGDGLICPACRHAFVFVRTSLTDDGAKEFVDQAYVIELSVIPPAGIAGRPVLRRRA
jgi:hypothetical protein